GRRDENAKRKQTGDHSHTGHFSPQPLRMRGVMKISSSWSFVLVVSRLNSHLISGTLPRPGVLSVWYCSFETNTPPMTVVWPSLTSTLVFARCVLIGGMPLTARVKSAWLFSSEMFMITVPAAVICGVTLSVSAASLNVTVTVLLATV